MKRTAYMYGFMKSSPDRTGWLRLSPSGYSVVDDRDDATGFDTENTPKRRGWGSPE